MPTPDQLERRRFRNRPQAGELWEIKARSKWRWEAYARILIISENIDAWGNTSFTVIDLEDGDVISNVEISCNKYRRVN